MLYIGTAANNRSDFRNGITRRFLVEENALAAVFIDGEHGQIDRRDAVYRTKVSWRIWEVSNIFA